MYPSHGISRSRDPTGVHHEVQDIGVLEYMEIMIVKYTECWENR